MTRISCNFLFFFKDFGHFSFFLLHNSFYQPLSSNMLFEPPKKPSLFFKGEGWKSSTKTRGCNAAAFTIGSEMSGGVSWKTAEMWNLRKRRISSSGSRPPWFDSDDFPFQRCDDFLVPFALSFLREYNLDGSQPRHFICHCYWVGG